MNKRYKVTKAFRDFEVDSIIEMEEASAKGLIEAGFLVEAEQKSNKSSSEDNDDESNTNDMVVQITKTFGESAEKAADLAAKKVLKQLSKGIRSAKAPTVEFGDSEEDKLISGKGFKHFTHFCVELKNAAQNPPSETLSSYKNAVDVYSKAAGDGIITSVDSEGGFLVPTEYRDQLMARATETSIVAGDATQIPMGTSSVEMPAMVDNDRSGSTMFGGIAVYREKEAGQYTASKPEFRKVGLKLNKLTGMAYCTDEMLSDSPQSMSALINTVFPVAIAYRGDQDYINGSGAGEPLGILNSGSLVTVAKESGQTADTIVYKNIINMYARMHWASPGKAYWWANHDTFPQLASLVIPAGTAGVPVWLPGNDLASAPHGTILGIPLRLTEHVASIGDVGDISLVKPSQYLIGKRSGEGLQAAVSIHLKFDYNQTAYRFTVRDDGQPWWEQPLTPKNGSTMSPFVTLAARE